jgi:chemotaxis protein MotB
MYTGNQAQSWERPQLHGVAAVQRTEAGLPWEREQAQNSIEQDTWLLSFIDVLTLLLTLFVLLLAYQKSASDQDGGAGVLIPAQLVQAVTQIITPDLPAPEILDEVQPLPESPVPGMDQVLQQQPSMVHENLTPDPTATVVVTKPEQLLIADSPIVDAPGGSSLFLSETTPTTSMVDPQYLMQLEFQTPDEAVNELAKLVEEQQLTSDIVPVDPMQKLLGDIEHSALNGRVEVSVQSDVINLIISDNILFTPASAALTASGRDVLDDLAATLKALPYALSVEGHTDNVPIQTAQYPSNWELSAARATMVTRHLIEQGVDAERIRAIGYADTRARADNGSAEGKARNRRVSFVLRMPTQADNAE